MRSRAVFAGLALLLVVVARPAQAAPIVGASLFAAGGPVTAVFLGESAGFTHDLYVFAASDLTTPLPVTADLGPGYATPGVFSTNAGSTAFAAPGDVVPLPAFAVGTELVFGLFVRDTGRTFFTGPGSRNVDALGHAAVDFAPPAFVDFDGLGGFPPIPIPPGLTLVGFEDLAVFEGSDFDFNDLGFAFSSVVPTAAPVPTAFLLLGTGAIGIVVRARRRTK